MQPEQKSHKPRYELCFTPRVSGRNKLRIDADVVIKNGVFYFHIGDVLILWIRINNRIGGYGRKRWKRDFSVMSPGLKDEARNRVRMTAPETFVLMKELGVDPLDLVRVVIDAGWEEKFIPEEYHVYIGSC